MKNNNKSYYFSLLKSFKDYTVNSGMISLGNSIELPVFLRRMAWRLLAACFPRKTKASNRLIQVYNFAKYIFKMRKHHGQKFAVAYLKACQLALQKRIAGDRIQSLREISSDLPFPRMAHCRLPRIIPLGDRRQICLGRTSVVR